METENNRLEPELRQNYLDLKERLETGLEMASRAENLYDAKGHLIEVQNHFKGLRLRKEDREELYNRLQEAFAGINRKISEEKLEFEMTVLSNFEDLKPEVEKAVEMASESIDTKDAWAFLLNVQDRVRTARLSREYRDLLNRQIQEAFDQLKNRRREEQERFGKESQQNYIRLKAMVDEGLKLAEETHEYKETREFLKKIQAGFKGTKMNREQREELYSRLQTAFDILAKRVDDFFRNKKKNWEVKMNFTLSRFAADIFQLKESINAEEENLEALKDQLGILISSGRDTNTILGIQSRIASAEREINIKRKQILDLEMESDALHRKLEGETGDGPGDTDHSN